MVDLGEHVALEVCHAALQRRAGKLLANNRVEAARQNYKKIVKI